MSNKTGWATEADVIVDFESLSAEQKAYRHSQKVWIDPALETLREANCADGISYIVSFADTKYRFYHTEDAWKYAPVADRAKCDYLYFVGTIASGLVWSSCDVKVWMANKNDCEV